MVALFSSTKAAIVLATLADAVKDRQAEVRQYGDVENIKSSIKNEDSKSSIIDTFLSIGWI